MRPWTHDNAEFRRAALACLEVARRLQAMALEGDDTCANHFANRDRAVAALLATAGPLSPRAAGAMSVLAEIVTEAEHYQAHADLSDWTPGAAMTPAQQHAERAEFTQFVEADRATFERRKVVPLHRPGESRP